MLKKLRNVNLFLVIMFVSLGFGLTLKTVFADYLFSSQPKGISVGNPGITLGGVENLFWGMIKSDSTGNFILLQDVNGLTYTDKFKLDHSGNITSSGNIDAVGNITAAGQNVCRQNGVNCPAGGGEVDGIIGNEVVGAANSTLTLSGSGTLAAPYKLALNLANANSWAALQTFSNGLTVSGGTLSLPANSVTNAMVSDTLTASDLVAGSSVVSNAEVDDNITVSNYVPLAGGVNITGGLNIAGNVGIRTSSPGYPLHIVDNDGTSVLNIDNIGAKLWNGLRLVSGGTEKWFAGMNSTDDKFRLRRNGATDDLVIDTNGKVGIGTTAPNAKLTVATSGAFDQFSLVNDGHYSGGWARGADMQFIKNDSSRHRGLTYGILGSGDGSTGAYFSAVVDDANPWSTAQLFLNSNGNVGIGTASPTHKLEIESSSDTPLYIKNTNTGDWTHAYKAIAPNLGTSQHYVFAEGGVAENTKNSAHLDFYYAGAGSNDNRLTMGLWGVDNVLNITGAGRVGIGYNSPTEALEVNGNIKASGDVSVGGNLCLDGQCIPTLSLFMETVNSKTVIVNSYDSGEWRECGFLYRLMKSETITIPEGSSNFEINLDNAHIYDPGGTAGSYVLAIKISSVSDGKVRCQISASGGEPTLNLVCPLEISPYLFGGKDFKIELYAQRLDGNCKNRLKTGAWYYKINKKKGDNILP